MRHYHPPEGYFDVVDVDGHVSPRKRKCLKYWALRRVVLICKT